MRLCQILVCFFLSSTNAFLLNRVVHGFSHSSDVCKKTSSRALKFPLMASTDPKKLLILGGTGFVGGAILKCAVERGHKVVAISRRGKPAENSPITKEVDWRQGDVTDLSVVKGILDEGGFSGVVHAVGILFEGSANRFASGSGSIPSPGRTYDDITRRTAFNALDALASTCDDGAELPFAFISAAEARWTFDGAFEGTPLAWLRRYLVAKRAVEQALLGRTDRRIRPIIFRPSLVWTWSKPGALLPVAAFTVGNRLGLPFVDKPVMVETLARAAVWSLESGGVRGVHDWEGMERLAGQAGTA